MNVTFIGGGNMATALIGGLVARGIATSGIKVVEVLPEARARHVAHELTGRLAARERFTR